MGNCLSKRRQSSILGAGQITPAAVAATLTAPHTPSNPLQTLSNPPQLISVPPDAVSPPSLSAPPQSLLTPFYGESAVLNAPNNTLVPAQLSMFPNAENVSIKGGSYSNIVNVNAGHGLLGSLDVLHKCVAPHAILNAGGRADEVRCHPGTREEVIDRIEKWGDALGDSAVPIFWLSGPAGAGKSAIVQTIAERCIERKIPQANFFFFRADTSRSDASPLIPTLVHQILQIYPSLKNPVATLLSDNPFILSSALEDQIEQLIVAPLSSVQQPSLPCRPLLLLIDGLDECDSESKRSQQLILRTFDKVLVQHSQFCPFRLLVASRDESQIQTAFNGLSSACVHLYLDDQYHPENDIRVFVNDKFTEVKKLHPLAYTLHAAWPLAEDIDYIVKKSSGHFIYSATVMRFILDSSSSPKLSLKRVQGAAQLATNSKSPFSHLDAIYTYILTQAEDQVAVKDILCAQLLITRLDTFSSGVFVRGVSLRDLPLLAFLELYDANYTEEVVLSCFANLTPISQYLPDGYQLLFYHASFSDYLLDKSRSGEYFVDVAAFNHRISPLIWKGIHSGNLVETVWEYGGILSLLELPTFPPGLLPMLSSSCDGWRDIPTKPNPPILDIIYKQCIIYNDINTFKYIIRQWIEAFDMDVWDAQDFAQLADVPFAFRYFHMHYAAQKFEYPDDEIRAALSPSSDFDCHESAVWLSDLLHAAYNKIYPDEPEQYNHLLQAWISWATENGISCQGLEDLHDAQKYIQPKA